jgi:integrase
MQSRPGKSRYPVKLYSLLNFLFLQVKQNKGSAKSLDAIVRALRVQCQMNRVAWLDEEDKRVLKEQIQYLKFVDPVPSQGKSPITFDMLARISSCLDKSKVKDARLLALTWMAYEGALRVDELLGGRRRHDINWNSNLSAFTLLLRRTKTHRVGDPLRVEFTEATGHCAVKYLRNWFRFNNLGNASPRTLLFPAANKSKTMSSTWFRTQVKRLVANIGLQSAQFSTHSFRAGLATDLFVADTPLQTVQWAGRWRSVCALIYYRSNVDKHQKVAKAIQTVRKAHGDKLVGLS